MTDKRRDDEFVPKIVYRRRPGPPADPDADAGEERGGTPYQKPDEGYTTGTGETIPLARRQGEPVPGERADGATGRPPRPHADRPSGPAREPGATPAAPVRGATNPFVADSTATSPATSPAATASPAVGRVPALGGELPRFLFALVDLVLVAALVFLVLYLFRVRAWELDGSYDVAEELDAAISGLNILLAAATVAAIGFLLSALGLLRGTGAGRKVALVWAWLMTISVLGAFYGLPALAWLTAASTKERFGAGPSSGTGRLARMPGRRGARGDDARGTPTGR